MVTSPYRRKGQAKNTPQSLGFRSGLEVKMSHLLGDMGLAFRYESKLDVIPWTSLPVQHKYHPDWVILENRKSRRIHLILETKGRFMREDMLKHLTIKIQNPHLDIRFVFQNPNAWHTRGTKRTYAKWCGENGFEFCAFKDAQVTLERWLTK